MDIFHSTGEKTVPIPQLKRGRHRIQTPVCRSVSAVLYPCRFGLPALCLALRQQSILGK